MTFLRTPTIRPLSITVVRVIALTGFVAAAAFIIRFAVFGSFHFVLNVNSPLNAECFAGLLFVALALLQPGYATLSRENTRRDFRLWLFITAAVTLAFVRTVSNPLLHDSYTHVVTAAKETWFTTLQIFYRHPASGDFFYRPVGYVSFWLDSKWAGFDPFRWHLVSLALHAVNSNLVYCFARQLAFTRTGSLVAALLFAFHGSRPEAVVWVAARFDLLAAFFLLLTLIAFCRFTATGSRPWLAALPVFTILALLSKEAAYCLPLLAFALLPLVPPPRKGERGPSNSALCFWCSP